MKWWFAVKVGRSSMVKYTVKNEELRSYKEDRIKTLNGSLLSMLESFQIEVFSFLIATNEEKGSFKELMLKFSKYFAEILPKFKLGELRLSRALDICLDIGFLKAQWHEDSSSFYRKFENKHEASKLFKRISNNYKDRKIKKNIREFRSLD